MNISNHFNANIEFSLKIYNQKNSLLFSIDFLRLRILKRFNIYDFAMFDLETTNYYGALLAFGFYPKTNKKFSFDLFFIKICR